MPDTPLPASWLHGRDTVVAWWRQRLLALPEGDAGRAVFWCDDDYAGWPLDEPAVLHALARWLRPAGRQLTVLARDYAVLAQQHPRFSRWRHHWVHRLATLQPEDAGLSLGSTAWLDQRAALVWQSREQWHALLVTDGPALTRLRGQFDALMQRSVSAWPANTLGL